MESVSSPAVSRGPRTRVCYVCGRSYGINSFEIHLKQCKELWVAREAQKPPRERKPLPQDPFLGEGGQGDGRGGYAEAASGINGLPSEAAAGTGGRGGSFRAPSASQLEAMNAAATAAFNTEALDTCAFCGRTFLPDKLKIHNKSCTADRPARRVDQSVRRHVPAEGLPERAAESRPGTQGGRRGGRAEDRDGRGVEDALPRRPKTTNSPSRPTHMQPSPATQRQMPRSPPFESDDEASRRNSRALTDSATSRHKHISPPEANQMAALLQKLADMEITSDQLNKDIREVKLIVRSMAEAAEQETGQGNKSR